MPVVCDRRQFLGQLAASGTALCSIARGEVAIVPSNRPASAYGLDFRYSSDELIADLMHGERGDPRRQSDIAHHEWYAAWVRHRFGAWGPPARRYAPLDELEQRPIEWQRERVIATAARFIGYDYQHHHIPDWDPPANWPWKHCCAGGNGRGFDCSNFTSFVYNQGFGIHLSSAIGRQSQLRHAPFGETSLGIHRVELPASLAGQQEVLRTGDLLYIRGREGGHVTHVVLWVGAIGRSVENVPLVLDSHGSGVKDAAGRDIPCGVHLRPFREHSWYHRCASHALRIFA
jgi:cell wall-associated NlpC family hydrolase